MEDKTIIFSSEHPSREACTSYSLAIDDALYAIGGKWKLKIITALLDGSLRFNELQRGVKGISATVLSHELKELELNGFVVRRIVETYPAMINYELSEYSYTLKEVIIALCKWGVSHREWIRSRAI
ncbi:winged helix-turn-helix transcriptional regulator [Desertivirga arenae]|uniref:winged helix-turn-helix transcriptional regulator n=1 Tax=Desertivirga arenae TaxID=2810309 RepID=UPI001A958E86|nr:helix-turn-helix domain-containing protein [Pedobacter sp. SYSU D00823]